MYEGMYVCTSTSKQVCMYTYTPLSFSLLIRILLCCCCCFEPYLPVSLLALLTTLPLFLFRWYLLPAIVYVHFVIEFSNIKCFISSMTVVRVCNYTRFFFLLHMYLFSKWMYVCVGESLLTNTITFILTSLTLMGSYISHKHLQTNLLTPLVSTPFHLFSFLFSLYSN